MESADLTPARLPISVIVPASQRVESLLKTLGRIQACDPAPAEILVHVDGASEQVLESVRSAFPAVRLLSSIAHQGPGGARNILVGAAQHELVANFDDDSFPEQPDYFAQVSALAVAFPEAAILSAANHDDPPSGPRYTAEALASGCGCVFRKSWYERVGGFVPLRIAYHMEEVDMGLRLHAMGGAIVRDAQLRVVHDKPPATEVAAELNAAILANTALLPFLRYPVWLWPVGILQVIRRLMYSMGRGWTHGLGRGLWMIGGHLHQYAAWRKPLPTGAIVSWLRLKRAPHPVPADQM